MKKIYRAFKAYYLLKHRNKFLATILAFFVTTLTFLFIGFVFLAIKSSRSEANNRPDYEKRPDKYRVVYKEGLFFTHKEYHER